MSVIFAASSTFLLLLILLLLLLSLALVLLARRRRHVGDVTWAPAVSGALPLLGNVLEIDRRHPHFTLSDWANAYGHVYRFVVTHRSTDLCLGLCGVLNLLKLCF